jgi:glutamate synthase domain-containing protein 3
VVDPDDAILLRQMIERHREFTGSRRAADILDRWGEFLPKFWKVVPHPAAGPSAGHELARSGKETEAAVPVRQFSSAAAR